MPAIDLTLIFACVVVFGAAIVRGFSGFGFSLLTITGLSLIYAPADIVPSIYLLEIAATVHMLPDIWKDIHWRSLLPLVAGCVVGTPFGAYALSHVPAAPMQLVIAVFVLASVALLVSGFSLKQIPGRGVAAAAGGVAGLTNGAFGIAGPPVMIFYFSSPALPASSRASLAAFFLCTDVIGIANALPHGLMTGATAFRAAVYLPFLIAGVWIGSRSFRSTSPETFRKVIMGLLAVLAALIAVRAVGQMF